MHEWFPGWQSLDRAVSLELQVVVGGEPKSAEKVELLTKFKVTLAER